MRSCDDITIDGVYQELIGLRQKNKLLEERIKQLENMTSRSWYKAGKNAEPNRPIFEKKQSLEESEEEDVVMGGKSRSFIVTIDEHNPKKLNGILQSKMRST